MEPKKSNLKREIYPMPDYIKSALEENNLIQAYNERPAYQQNDYVGWITRAKREETRTKRLTQMVEELTGGKVYMKMKWNGKPGL